MTTLIIRDVKPAVLRRLQQQATANRRSVQAEVQALLERHAGKPTMAEWLQRMDRLRAEIPPWRPGMPTAVELVREGRGDW
jgi:plasmid stability protein